LFELRDILLVVVFHLGDFSIFFSQLFITIQLDLGDRIFELSLINLSIPPLLQKLLGERFNTDILLKELLSQSSNFLLHEAVVFLAI